MKKYEYNGGASLKHYAQRQLDGLTHYVDEGTLRFHKSKITAACPVRDGHLFLLVTSDALDWNNTRRGFRFALFDTSGHVVDLTFIENAHTSTKKALEAGMEAADAADLKAIYAEMKERAERAHAYHMQNIDKLAAEA